MTDLLHERSAPVTHTVASAPCDPQRVALIPIPCVYCWESIPALSFAYLSPARRVLSAPCLSCDRRMTLAVSTWRRWSSRTELAPE
jgi:hypothetical protein